uniref:AB hydrolase-1 domain-containing protein n=1 Tax=Tetraselmis sp. GSL018 TaxID=582737 RepID=A0A061SE42_9CHLO|mmetsp:Transcript_25392/g.60391  ORF Transcript_25392/g.60391 Transcript_25392/m.60391 type:complete len:398 (+) Transcript_25392:195-1388(+)
MILSSRPTTLAKETNSWQGIGLQFQRSCYVQLGHRFRLQNSEFPSRVSLPRACDSDLAARGARPGQVSRSLPRHRYDIRATAAPVEVGSHVQRTFSLPTLAHEIVAGSQVTWAPSSSRAEQPPPTAVLVHGIMGSKRNLQSLARRLVEVFPSWQVLLVDLRNHGGSANLPWPEPSTVEAAAADVLRLLSQLKLFPRLLIGHSFGGKVVLSMAQQFCAGKSRLPRPAQVWVLDALPGDIRSEDSPDHPKRLINKLREVPMPLRSRKTLLEFLAAQGFSDTVAQWVATNLRPTTHNRSLLNWTFDIEGIAQMYESYEQTNLWPIIMERPAGLDIDFVRAEKSTFRWAGPEQEVLESYNCGVYTLLDAGHWVHHDNLNGLVDILRDSIVTHDIMASVDRI